MNSKTAKTLRKFAELNNYKYNYVKSRFQLLPKITQRKHLAIMRVNIALNRKGVKYMATQKLCDRCKQLIQENDNYFPIIIKGSGDADQKIDLDEKCGKDFLAFLNQNPYGQTAMPQQLAQPVNPPVGNGVPADPASNTQQ